MVSSCAWSCSIHPQGWVPIVTTRARRHPRSPQVLVAFTPKGGCPLKLPPITDFVTVKKRVAFTPKGGCPLKQTFTAKHNLEPLCGSIHPQGWVPIETCEVGEKCLYIL